MANWVRLQAALRSIAGLGPGEYRRTYYPTQPRFLASSVKTEHSIDILLVVGVLETALAAPGAIEDWRRFAPVIYRHFKVALIGLVQGEIQAPGDIDNDNHLEGMQKEDKQFDGIRIEVTRGEVNVQASRPFLAEMRPDQARKLRNFLWSILGPTRKVDIGDQESEISIGLPDEPEGQRSPHQR